MAEGQQTDKAAPADDGFESCESGDGTAADVRVTGTCTKPPEEVVCVRKASAPGAEEDMEEAPLPTPQKKSPRKSPKRSSAGGSPAKQGQKRDVEKESLQQAKRARLVAYKDEETLVQDMELAHAKVRAERQAREREEKRMEMVREEMRRQAHDKSRHKAEDDTADVHHHAVATVVSEQKKHDVLRDAESRKEQMRQIRMRKREEAKEAKKKALAEKRQKEEEEAAAKALQEERRKKREKKAAKLEQKRLEEAAKETPEERKRRALEEIRKAEDLRLAQIELDQRARSAAGTYVPEQWAALTRPK
eukprot:TRINITY_DN7002_c1_g1_i1.p1 TRINITY_DN7002_c1_g1~~TRINITY_DN7002_c1_g1_i1.p1  ORF type:complete len:305 (+),score=105.12 TRINITY_DN7002_c1_g1_i1:64-978(+)